MARMLGAVVGAKTHAVRVAVRRGVSRLVSLLLVCVVCLMGVSFALIGCYESLAINLADWQAGLIVCAGTLAISALVFLWVRRTLFASRLGASSAGSSEGGLTTTRKPGLGTDDLTEPLAGRPRRPDAMLAAFVAGVVLGMSSRSASATDRDWGRR